jgi:iron complex transport system substrate-binding protein
MAYVRCSDAAKSGKNPALSRNGEVSSENKSGRLNQCLARRFSRKKRCVAGFLLRNKTKPGAFLMKRLSKLLIALSLFLVACSTENESGSKLTYVPKESGMLTELPAASGAVAETASPAPSGESCHAGPKPQAIVSLSPTATEMLYAVGAGSQVAAVDEFSYWPPEAPVREGLSGWNPNVESIAGLQPDLVVLSDGGIQEELELLGISVYVADAAMALEDVYDQMYALGEITCQRLGALQAVSKMRASMDALVEVARSLGEGLTYYHELDDTLYSIDSSTFIGQIYALVGLVNIADSADPEGTSWGYPQLTAEFVLQADPDVIFFADAQCCAQSIETISSRPGWSELEAVKNGHVFEIDSDISSRWGPRLVEFLSSVVTAIRTMTGN